LIRHTLSNGVRVLMEEMPTMRSVSFGIWVKTGSRNETARNNGISHLIEHMLFKGSEKYSAQQIAEIFDGIGGNVNAFTSKEYTCYYFKVLDSHLPIAMDVLADMFFRSRMDPDELEKEKGVILEEIAMYEDTPDDYVHDLISEAAYPDHSLSFPILGREPVLSRITVDDIRDYMRQHYHVRNIVISAAGHLDDSVLPLVERYFGNFSNSGNPAAIVSPRFAARFEVREKQTEQNHMCIAFPGLAIDDDRIYDMVLLNNVIGGGMSSRLFQEIREQRGLAYSVYSYHTAHLDSGLFTIYAGTMPKHTREALETILAIVDGIAANGITAAELEKGKEQLKGSVLLSLESTSSRMNRLGKNELLLGRHDSLEESLQKVDRIDLDSLRTLAREVLSRPFAAALVGHPDDALTRLWRDRNGI